MTKIVKIDFLQLIRPKHFILKSKIEEIKTYKSNERKMYIKTVVQTGNRKIATTLTNNRVNK